MLIICDTKPCMKMQKRDVVNRIKFPTTVKFKKTTLSFRVRILCIV